MENEKMRWNKNKKKVKTKDDTRKIKGQKLEKIFFFFFF